VTAVLVGLFGGLGAVVRYLAEYAVRARHPRERPWATVAVNALGCGIAAFVIYRFSGALDAHWRDVVVTGFCGGLTTFSSAFAVPAILQREHHWGYSATLLIATPVACLALYQLGLVLAR
jgi:fluoride exporter